MNSSKETIAIGGDEAGFALKKVVIAHLEKNGRLSGGRRKVRAWHFDLRHSNRCLHHGE
jgi:hypothetical protein